MDAPVCDDECASLGLSRAQYGIDSVVLSKERALVGETLTAYCNVRVELTDPDRPPRVLLFWIREVPNEQLPVEISVNRALSNAFRSTGRYSVGLVELAGKSREQFQVQLNITGALSCLAGRDGNGSVGHGSWVKWVTIFGWVTWIMGHSQ